MKKTAMKKHLEWLKARIVITPEMENQLLKEEIEQLAEKNFPIEEYPTNEGFEHFAYKQGYTQCQEDMAKLTFVPGLSKETLDELFNLHDDDDFIHEDSDKKYTEEDMMKVFEYGKTLEPFDCFEDFINSLNKQD